jgi:hypothetical protein
VDSRTFGVATMEEAELSSWRARVRDVPGGVLTSIDALAFPGDRGSLHLVYEATLRDGTRHECTHAWSRDGAVLAAFRTAEAAGAAGAIVSGSAATMLITEQEASAIVGEPMGPPMNNGGKLGFAPGVDASNGAFGPGGNNPRPGQICADWTLYLAKDRATAEAFWESFKKTYSLQPRFQPWLGVGDEALAEPGFPGTYVFKGRSVLAFQQLYPCANDRTLEAGVAAQWARKIVETMVSRLL